MCKSIQFSVGTNIKEAAGSIIRAGSESIAVGEKPMDDRSAMRVNRDEAVHTRRR